MIEYEIVEVKGEVIISFRKRIVDNKLFSVWGWIPKYDCPINKSFWNGEDFKILSSWKIKIW